MTRRATLIALALLSACTRKGDRAPASPSGPGDESGEPPRAEVLRKTANDPGRPREERLAAAIERAKLLGLEVPPSPHEWTPPPRVEVPVPEGPPSLAPVDDGAYLLSLGIDYAGGPRVDERLECDLERSGESVEIRPRRKGAAVITGTLKAGRLVARGDEREAVFILEGQVTGPGRIAGSVSGGSADAGVSVREGRWSLERME